MNILLKLQFINFILNEYHPSFRHIKTDLLLCFKIIDCGNVTIGHDLRPRRQYTVVNARLFHFSQRVIKHWHNLSQEQVHSIFISACKRSIESLHDETV